MFFKTNYLALILCLSTFVNALPLDGASSPRVIAPRAKSYSIVNVDGGSTSAPPPEATTIVEVKTKTRTVEVTATIVDPTPAPVPTLSSASASSSAPKSTLTSTLQTLVPTPSSTLQPTPSSSEQHTETEKPSIVTVIVTAPAEPTEYYDNGIWHTSYVIKSFTAAAVATPRPSS